jgi:hypothetical protein
MEIYTGVVQFISCLYVVFLISISFTGQYNKYRNPSSVARGAVPNEASGLRPGGDHHGHRRYLLHW